MKRFTINGLTAGFILAATVVSMNAQTVNQRRENQQDRIAQGVKAASSPRMRQHPSSEKKPD